MSVATARTVCVISQVTTGVLATKVTLIGAPLNASIKRPTAPPGPGSKVLSPLAGDAAGPRRAEQSGTFVPGRRSRCGARSDGGTADERGSRLTADTAGRPADLCAEAGRALGFDPAVRFVGPVEAQVAGALADDVVAVVREALANVARHARAAALPVRTVDDGSLDRSAYDLVATRRRSLE
jgi:hypothetical protein